MGVMLAGVVLVLIGSLRMEPPILHLLPHLAQPVSPCRGRDLRPQMGAVRSIGRIRPFTMASLLQQRSQHSSNLRLRNFVPWTHRRSQLTAQLSKQPLSTVGHIGRQHHLIRPSFYFFMASASQRRRSPRSSAIAQAARSKQQHSSAIFRSHRQQSITAFRL